MPKVTPREAVKAYAVSGATLMRALSNGTISADKSDAGHWQIDAAELARVYAPRDVSRASPASLNRHEIPPEPPLDHALATRLAIAEAAPPLVAVLTPKIAMVPSLCTIILRQLLNCLIKLALRCWHIHLNIPPAPRVSPLPVLRHASIAGRVCAPVGMRAPTFDIWKISSGDRLDLLDQFPRPPDRPRPYAMRHAVPLWFYCGMAERLSAIINA